eukprot:6442355-Pyramimonas_sp.AAC.1
MSGRSRARCSTSPSNQEEQDNFAERSDQYRKDEGNSPETQPLGPPRALLSGRRWTRWQTLPM